MEKETGMKRTKKREKIEGKTEERMNGKVEERKRKKVRKRRDRRERVEENGEGEKKYWWGKGGGEQKGTKWCMDKKYKRKG
jgi:hypothetical protein